MVQKRRDLGFDEGTITNSSGDSITGTASRGAEALIQSYPGRHDWFESFHDVFSGGLANGSWVNPDPGWGGFQKDTNASNYPVSMRRLTDIPILVEAPGRPSTDWLATQLLAGTKPDQPEVDIANFIGELKDLPGMLKSIGDSFLNKGVAYAFGHLNLTYKFGWAPFAKDVMSMFNFSRLVEKRFKELSKLRENGSTIRKSQLWSGSSSRSKPGFHAEGGLGIYDLEYTSSAMSRVWGYVIWKTNQQFPSSDYDLAVAAWKTALGLNTRPEIVWNLLPWSWAIDWFLNVGSFLEASNNSTGIFADVCCLCEETINETTVTFSPRSDYPNISPAVRKQVRHLRRPTGTLPTLTAQVPTLSKSQLGILASISATRR